MCSRFSIDRAPRWRAFPCQPTWLSYLPKSQGHCFLGGETGKEGELLTWPCRCSVPNEAQWLIPLKFVTHPCHHGHVVCSWWSSYMPFISPPSLFPFLPSLSPSLPLFPSAMSDKVPAEASPAVCSCNQRPPSQHSRWLNSVVSWPLTSNDVYP